jgi:hypothetical protein
MVLDGLPGKAQQVPGAQVTLDGAFDFSKRRKGNGRGRRGRETRAERWIRAERWTRAGRLRTKELGGQSHCLDELVGKSKGRFADGFDEGVLLGRQPGLAYNKR